MRSTFFIIVFLLISSFSYGQGEANNWFFGINMGITFNTSPPSIVDTIYANETFMPASISDSAGNVLFYVDGSFVRDRRFYTSTNIMPSSWTIFRDHRYPPPSSVILRIDQYRYFVFSIASHAADTIGLEYHIVDMRENGGYGDVVLKNQKIYGEGVYEKLALIRNSTGTGYWLIVRDNLHKKFLSYLVEGSHILPPVETIITDTIGLRGKIKVSPDQKRIAVCNKDVNIRLYDFDNATGKLQNPIVVLDSAYAQEVKDCEFSADGNYLYYATNYFYLNQVDISLPSTQQMEASITQIAETDTIVINNQLYRRELTAMQMGPDGKIYILTSGFYGFFSVIQNPNGKGALSNFEYKSIQLPYDAGFQIPGIGLPFFYGDILRPLNFRYHDVCLGDSTKLVIDNNAQYDSLFWDFGEPSSGINNTSLGDSVWHQYSSAGQYTATLYAHKFQYIDTLVWQVNIHNYPVVTLGPDTNICEEDVMSFKLASFDTNQYHFLWSDSSTQNHTQVDTTTQLSVKVDIAGCAGYDTVIVTEIPYYVFPDFPDTFSCEGDTLLMSAGTGADSYNWSTGELDSIAAFTETGTYHVTATMWQCEAEDSIRVVFHPKPIFSLGADTVICNTDSITLSGTANVKHLWSVGDTNRDLKVKNAGEYILKQNTQYCTWLDTIQISVQQQPTINIGNDTVLCIGERVIIGNAVPNGVSYTWSHAGSTTPKVVVSQQDDYSVIAYDGVCRAYDTVFVGIYTPQNIELGADSTLCEGTETELDVTITRGKYLWNDGVQTPDRIINTTGRYDVQITDSVCSYADTITLTFNPVPPLNLGPDTVLCQDEVHQVSVNSGWDEVSWSDGSNNFSRVFTAEGVYRVTAGYLNCEELDTLQIGYHAPLPDLDLGEDKDVCDPLFYVLESSYSGYYSTQWQDGTKGNYYEVTKTGDYIISTLPHRCGQVSDTIHITFLRELCDLHIPNAFSPNGDGDNDYFFPVGYQMDVENMQIYSRWGELLYDGNQPWDGTYQGAKLPNGAYLYIITYKKEHRGAKKRMLTKGTVQILK